MFHSTATAGTIAAAATAARLLRLSKDEMLSAIGTAGTQAAGLWQYLLDASHSKQVHTGMACFNGVFSAYTAMDGLLGPRDILEGQRGMGYALVPQNKTPEAIDSRLGVDFAVLRSSFKWHASCRHTHPSVDALLALMEEHDIGFDDIEAITARTYQAAIDVLSLSGKGSTIHQGKFCMSFVLAITAKKRHAFITDFQPEDLEDPSIRAFQDRVTMELDPEINSRFPEKWQGTVILTCKDGRTFRKFVEYLKGDPQYPLSRYYSALPDTQTCR